VFWKDLKGKCYFRETSWFATGEMASQQEFSWKAQPFEQPKRSTQFQKPYTL